MIEQVFENLVNQFSDPFTFYRELIQNALDAGSTRVDVSLTFRPEEERAVIEVADNGEGMDRDIIQHQLTRLFSSSKEGDLTKIGKFGIGFVSVFAIEPELVVVDTGRSGEYWRVVFDGTTDFQCLALSEPLEGTRIRLFKKLREADYAAFEQRSRETVSHWCRYSDTPIMFGGKPVNETLGVDSPCQVRDVRPGTEVVAGLTAEGPPVYGFYNRGLTLKEGRQEFLAGVCFRMRSRYLEHTMARDNVMQDENYDKAIQILRDVVSARLESELFRRAASLLDKGDLVSLDTLLTAASPYLAASTHLRSDPLSRDAPLFPTLHEGATSIARLCAATSREKAVYVDPSPGHATRRLHELGIPVVQADEGSGIAMAVEAVTGVPPRPATRSVAAPQILEDAPLPPGFDEMAGHLRQFLRQGRMRVREIVMASFDYHGSPVKAVPCLAQQGRDDVVRLFERRVWSWAALFPRVLLLNAHHPLIVRALKKAARDPLLSAFVVAKAALLQDGLPADLEARLLQRCVRELQP